MYYSTTQKIIGEQVQRTSPLSYHVSGSSRYIYMYVDYVDI